jgi:G:T-mismatch repair DNA endonuclease (very short patch repair protein)
MPRILLPRKVPLTNQQMRDRAKVQRYSRAFEWIDPYPDVYGTKPEKMIYAELMRRGIVFQFTAQINTGIPDIEVNQWFKPDFIIPAYRMIIEVQGAYWHTKPDKIESDSLRFALMQMAGYRVIAWWDYDIESRLQELFSEVPELGFTGMAVASPGRSAFTDDLKGLRKANEKHRKPWTHKTVKLKMKREAKLVKGVSPKKLRPRKTIL